MPRAGNLNASNLCSINAAGLGSAYNGVKGDNNTFLNVEGGDATDEKDAESLGTMG